MSNMISKVKMSLINDVWITSITHLNVELISMASDIRESLKGLQESIDYVEINTYRELIKRELA